MNETQKKEFSRVGHRHLIGDDLPLAYCRWMSHQTRGNKDIHWLEMSIDENPRMIIDLRRD